jgi:hypothetical protein
MKVNLTETVDALVFSLPGETNDTIAVDKDASNKSTLPQATSPTVNLNMADNSEVIQALVTLSESMQYLGDEGRQKLREELVVKTLEDMPNLEAIKHLAEVVSALAEKEKEPVKIEFDPIELDASLFTEKMSMTFGEVLAEVVRKRDEQESNQVVRYELNRNEKNLITSITKYVSEGK